MESSRNVLGEPEKYLIYFTNQYITDVIADDWKIRDGRFLIFYLRGREISVYNFSNIFGFCSMGTIKKL